MDDVEICQFWMNLWMRSIAYDPIVKLGFRERCWTLRPKKGRENKRVVIGL